MQPLIQYWYEVLSEDLQAFADPGISPEIDIDNTTFITRWVVRGAAREARFRLTATGDFRWADGGEDRTYPEFLSSPLGANLPQLASTIKRRYEAEIDTSSFVSSKCLLDTDKDAKELTASDCILREITAGLTAQSGRTKVLFVKADAGAGKTTLLEYLTLQQTTRVNNGAPPFLFLFVSAQGRALSNLRDALAAETQNIRADFTWEAVAPLCRRGVIIPIIDGFDELLGAVGYGDAFASLTDFLASLHGDGVIIVSARSSFYDVEFVNRLDPTSTSSLVEVTPISLLPWKESDITQYIELRVKDVEKQDEALALYRNLPGNDKKLLTKPFFCSLFPQYVESRTAEAYPGTLKDFLIDSYIKRESQKIVDRDGAPLLDSSGHRQYFLEIADHMWMSSTRQVSASDLRVIAELIAVGSGLSSDASQQFITKVTSYAGFSVFGGDRFAFEHDVYFDYFLAQGLRRYIDKQSDTFLDRAILARETCEIVFDEYGNTPSATDFLLSVDRSDILQENRRRNVGTLLASCLRVLGGLVDREVSSVNFSEVSLDADRLVNIVFRNCQFVAVSAIDTLFNNCEFVGCQAHSITVSGRTRFVGPPFVPENGLYQVKIIDTGDELYSPEQIVTKLVSLGVFESTYFEKSAPLDELSERVVELLSDLERCYRRANPICVGEDPGSMRVAHNKYWPEVERALVECGILQEENKHTSGPAKKFLRQKLPVARVYAAVRSAEGSDTRVLAFWRSIRKRLGG